MSIIFNYNYFCQLQLEIYYNQLHFFYEICNYDFDYEYQDGCCIIYYILLHIKRL